MKMLFLIRIYFLPMKHYNIIISGKVQRVGFRFSATEAACRFSINGFVRNSGYDKVYVEAEGADDRMDLFLAWCRKGPLGAHVEQVELEEAPVRNFTRFDIVSRVE